jgi:CHASE2 domain-containing sensor protein
MFAKSAGIAVAHALAGWVLCGATMFVGMAVTTSARALAIHAVAAPIIFAAISWVYFRRFGSWSPLSAASAFVGVVVAMDFFVVALFIEKSFDMFRSVTGTWLPFALIFISTWYTGLAVRH